jgi:hypothetical protein
MPPSKRQPLNVRREAARLRVDPLDKLVQRLIRAAGSPFLIDEVGRYVIAYDCYYLTIARFYRELSIGYRWRESAYYTWKHRGRYSPYERRLTDEYRNVAAYLELDLFNCVIHARILLDRAVGLARSFLPRHGERPSFSSFADHKRFFERRTVRDDRFADYAEYFQAKTGWFDELKEIRDKFLVHQGPKHTRHSGYPFERVDLHLAIGLPIDEKKPLGGGDYRIVSIRDIALHIDEFLTWFCRRGLRALRQTQTSVAQ